MFATVDHKNMNMIWTKFYRFDSYTQSMRFTAHQRFHQFSHTAHPKYLFSVFRRELQVVITAADTVPTMDYLHFIPPKVF